MHVSLWSLRVIESNADGVALFVNSEKCSTLFMHAVVKRVFFFYIAEMGWFADADNSNGIGKKPEHEMKSDKKKMKRKMENCSPFVLCIWKCEEVNKQKKKVMR